MKKTTPLLMLCLLILTSFAAAMTATTTYTSATSFKSSSYLCADNSCNSMTAYQNNGPSTNHVMSYSAAAAPVTWIVFHYDPNSCVVPRFTREYFPSNINYGNLNYPLTFSKTDSSICGSMVESISKNSANIIQPGTLVTVNANLRSAWDEQISWLQYIPSELDQYYNSKVNVFYKVYKNDVNTVVYQSTESVLINWNEQYNAHFSYAPTEPGTYIYEISTNMFDDCKCAQPSNVKNAQITVTVPQPYCGDSICNDGNDKTCEPNGATKDDICTSNVDSGDLTDGICRTTGTNQCTYCGDGDLQTPEETCDYNVDIENPDYVPGCRDSGDYACTFCGDGIRQSIEQCDYAIDSNCDQTCNWIPICGDSICNDGNDKTCEPDGATKDDICTDNVDTGDLSNDVCRTTGPHECTYCGDGVKQTPEETCDYNVDIENPDYVPGCRDSGDYACTFCGDGIVQPPEECDWLNDNECDHTCHYNKCEIELIKTDSPDPVIVGQELVYGITVENIGTADCTGGGVLLEEHYPSELEFLFADPESISDDNVWNFGTLHPGDREVVFIHTRVKSDTSCPSTILNEACVWADQIPDWQCTEESTDIICPPCTDECSSGEFTCSGSDLWECGNYDDDSCTEYHVVTDCNSETIGQEYDICSGDTLETYHDLTTGFCNAETDSCDTETTAVKVSDHSCSGETILNTYDVCESDSLVTYNTVESGFCNVDACDSSTDEVKVADHDCSGENIVGTHSVCEGDNLATYNDIETGICNVDACDVTASTEKVTEENCYYHTLDTSYNICEGNSLAEYQSDETGFCNDDELICDTTQNLVKIGETDCNFEETGDINKVCEDGYLNEYQDVVSGVCNIDACVSVNSQVKITEENCNYVHDGETYSVCEEGSSVSYKDTETGFCDSGELACDSSMTTEKIDTIDCESTSCITTQFCKNNDVYENTDCIAKGCDDQTGLCYSEDTAAEVLVDDCGDDLQPMIICQDENIVEKSIANSCAEHDNTASCITDDSYKTIEDCGNGDCTSYTNMNPLTLEFVADGGTCEDISAPVCAPDVSPSDFCINSEILSQVYCAAEGHSFQEFDCNSLNGCYDVQIERCANCRQPDGSCEKTDCSFTGKVYRDYSCGAGVCSASDSALIDIDHDMIDDRCDTCIDADQDKTCDDTDNCKGVYNPSQVDTDRNGLGDACSDDKDGDGYQGTIDCNDWNAKINPGAAEIKNNGIDDDCNANTEDKGTYSAREALYVDLLYDESQIKPGDMFDVVVSVTNNDMTTLKDVQILVSIPGMQAKQTKLIQTLKSGETGKKVFSIEMPNDLSRYEYLRVAVSDNTYKRTIYREIRLK
ncbi:MAG: MopE-related protein [archaeon]